jgi:hypothetical protein
VDGEPYPTLLQDKGFRGFPSLCFMDADGNVLTQPQARTVASYRETHASTKAMSALRQKGDKATPAEQRELFLAELKLGLVKAADIQARADKVKLTDADKALVAGKLVDAEIGEVMANARAAGPEKTAEALVAIHKSGRKPSADVSPSYWVQLLTHAAKQKDGALADEAYAALEAKLGKEKNAERMFTNWKKLRDDAHAK